MASRKAEFRGLHSNITQLCLPEILADTSSTLQLNTELLKLEAHIRRITSPDTFWSTARPLVKAFDAGSCPSQTMFPARRILEPLPTGLERDVCLKTISSSPPSSPAKDTRMVAPCTQAEEMQVVPEITQILHTTNTQPFLRSMPQRPGAGRTLQDLSPEELLAYLDTMPFAKVMIEQKLAMKPAKAAPKPASLVPVSEPVLLGREATGNVNSTKFLFEAEVELRVAQAKLELRKTMELEHRETVDKIKGAFKAKLDETIAKQKDAVAEISKSVPTGYVPVQTTKNKIVNISNQEATRLICENNVIGRAYKDLCMQVLHKYKEKVREEYWNVLRMLEIDPDLTERGKSRLKKLRSFLPPTPTVPINPSMVLVENVNPSGTSSGACSGTARRGCRGGNGKGGRIKRGLSAVEDGTHGTENGYGPHEGVLQPKRVRMNWDNV